MNKKLILLIGAGILILASVLFFTSGSAGTTALWNVSQEGKLLFPLVGVSALIDSVNPCAFSVLLLTIAFLFSLGRARGSILKLGAAYIVGIFAAYLLIGLGLLGTLHLFNTPHFMAKVGAGLLVALGAVNIVGALWPSFPVKLGIPHAAHRRMAWLMERASVPAAILLGALTGLCEFPCTGGPYLMVLGLLRDAGTYLRGIGYLFFYNLIFILPLVVILLIAGNKALVAKVQAWKKAETKKMKLWGGIAMIALGLLIFAL